MKARFRVVTRSVSYVGLRLNRVHVAVTSLPRVAILHRWDREKPWDEFCFERVVRA